MAIVNDYLVLTQGFMNILTSIYQLVIWHDNWIQIGSNRSQRMDTHSVHNIDDWCRAVWFLTVVDSGLLTDQSPQLIQIDAGEKCGVLFLMVIPHAYLPKVPWMAMGMWE